MNKHIDNLRERIQDLFLDDVRKLMRVSYFHLHVNLDMQVEIYVIGTAAGADLVAAFNALNSKHNSFYLLRIGYRGGIAQYPRLLPYDDERGIGDKSRNKQRNNRINDWETQFYTDHLSTAAEWAV